MKLLNVEPTEVEVLSVFVITCFMCTGTNYISRVSTVGEAINKAAADGWHGYETDGEVCSTACPKCIQEVKENEAESKK
ncbi:hypothetical protein [Shewanella sp. 0m-4]